MPVLSTMRLSIAERQRGDVVRTLRVLKGRSTAKAGCLGFHVSLDVLHPSVVIVSESWATREDLDAHLRSADYKLLLAIIDLSEAPPEIRFDLVEPIGGLEVVWTVRTAPQGTNETPTAGFDLHTTAKGYDPS